MGDLSVPALRSVLRRYADACMETAKRKRRGERARYPRRRRHLVPLRYYQATFELEDRRIRLSVACGAPELWLRLTRPVPYPADQVRSVTLLCDAGRLVLDVTAEVPVPPCSGTEVAGVDPGMIHPFAVAGGSDALLVSGRAILGRRAPASGRHQGPPAEDDTKSPPLRPEGISALAKAPSHEAPSRGPPPPPGASGPPRGGPGRGDLGRRPPRGHPGRGRPQGHRQSGCRALPEPPGGPHLAPHPSAPSPLRQVRGGRPHRHPDR